MNIFNRKVNYHVHYGFSNGDGSIVISMKNRIKSKRDIDYMIEYIKQHISHTGFTGNIIIRNWIKLT